MWGRQSRWSETDFKTDALWWDEGGDLNVFVLRVWPTETDLGTSPDRPLTLHFFHTQPPCFQCGWNFWFKIKCYQFLKIVWRHFLVVHQNVTCLLNIKDFPRGTRGKESACQCRRHEMQIPSLSPEDPLERDMASHSSILAWKIPWTEEPGGLQSVGLKSQTWLSDWAQLNVNWVLGTERVLLILSTVHLTCLTDCPLALMDSSF